MSELDVESLERQVAGLQLQLAEARAQADGGDINVEEEDLVIILVIFQSRYNSFLKDFTSRFSVKQNWSFEE